MLATLIASTEIGETIIEWIEIAALFMEIMAVIIIVIAVFYAGISYVSKSISKRGKATVHYRELKTRLGKALLLGLEILVAADIVRTVALESTLNSVAVLGLLVLIRTFLSWSLVVEIESRWPWQPERPSEES